MNGEPPAVEEQAGDIRERMRHDMLNTLRQHLGETFVITGTLLDALLDDGMFPVEHLLAKQEDQ